VFSENVIMLEYRGCW